MTSSEVVKMWDQSEIDELYDEFLDLDGNPFNDLNFDSKVIVQELNKTENEVDSKWNVAELGNLYSNLRNNNIKQNIDDDNANTADKNHPVSNINNINNNNLINIRNGFGQTDSNVELDLLNQNLFNGDANCVDKNGKIQSRIGENEFASVNYNNGRPSRPTSLFTKAKETEMDTELKEVDEQRASPELPSNDATFHRSDWGPESLGLWHSGPSSLSLGHSTNNSNAQKQDLSSVASFTSSVGFGGQPLNSFSSSTRRAYSHQQLGAKVEMVYSLLSMLGTSNRNDMSKTLLAMSSSPESCLAMRQSGCLPLLIQLIHSPDLDIEVRSRAAEALQNIVLAQTDEKKRRREARVLKLLQQIREYCDDLKILATDQNSGIQDEPEKHPISAVEALMKFSFDAEHRQAMCSLGGLHAIAELIQLDHEVHSSMSDNPICITLRRYAGMSLTNLIFGDGNNKALLCSFKKFMRALVSQLMSPSEDLRQVTASVLRNLSWRADAESKQALREIGAVTALMVAAMEGKKESTLKSILSALWNLSAHCSMNKVDVCAVPGAVAFLVKMLKYKAASNTLAVIENAGGILRNISSHIAVREDYRQILRDNNCFEILLEQLKSPSLTIVSNACGTLWNLSARCSEDQRRLWEMGAISMLRSLIQSKHKMISMGSSAALKNLLSANPGGNMFNHLDSTAKSLGLQNLPTLFVRKQRALEQELDINLSETCDNIEPSVSPIHSEKAVKSEERRGTISRRSDSHESVTSTQSDSAYERVNQLLIKNENKVLENKNATMHSSLNDSQSGRKADEQKLIRRYKSSMIPTPAFKKLNQEKKNEKTKVENITSDIIEKPEEVTNTTSKKNTEVKEKRGIPVLKNRIKTKNEIQDHETNCGQYFSRSNFTTQYEDEYPVNYSLKYSESEVYGEKINSECIKNSKKDLKGKKKFDEYPDYAETDLDQPTDFSLKYGEETSSDEELKNREFNYYENDKAKESGYYSGPPDTEDTTRTYYTEGTPYEGTPYNFSSSNSMSDLRIDQADVRETVESSFQHEKDDIRKLTPNESSLPSNANGKDCQNLYDNNSGDYRSRVKRLPRDFESGVSTPERPVQYCEEGTPGGCLSRVSSLSSLSGGKELSNKNSPEKLDKQTENKDLKKSLKHLESEETLQNKAVTFGVTQQYKCADQTPLMFSRSSSMNSLNSFEQIHQSIPDDRSSVVSDFSRMTSGIISPSELPDSPTQTVPPSPKQCKTSVYFPSKLDSQKKSVFEDAVATYKQEDTPIEFSRATSLSSLNIENSVKQDFNLKTNSSSSSIISMDDSKVKDDKHNNSLEKTQSDDLKEQIVPEKSETEREKLELQSVTEEDEDILVDCINIGIQENSRRPRLNGPKRCHKKNSEIYLSNSSSQDGDRPSKLSGIPIKTNNRAKYQNDTRKIYPSYDESDDAVHTYYTEGTPANISHAGSHSDLSNLNMVTGDLLPPSTTEDTSDDGSFCSGDTENMLAECIQSGMPKAKHQKVKAKNANTDNSINLALNKGSELVANKILGNRVEMVNANIYAGHQTCNDYLRRKDHHLTAKDETSTFATENSPCNFSVRSSLSDLTVNSVDSPVCFSRPEVNRDQISQVIPCAEIASEPSSNSIGLIEPEEGVKTSEENMGIIGLPKKIEKETRYWEERNATQPKTGHVASFPAISEGKYSENVVSDLSRHKSLSSLSVESFDSSEPTPLEQALLEQCIHSGMPHKTQSKKPELKNYEVNFDRNRILRMPNIESNRADFNLDSVKEAESPKNVNTSSATVEENTEADEKRSGTLITQENTKTEEQAVSDSISYKMEYSNGKTMGESRKSDYAGNQGENSNSSYGNGQTWSEDYISPNDSSVTCASISEKVLRIIHDSSDGSCASKDCSLLPNFKIGSEVRDPKLLRAEATKICREIGKYQDFDMSCSLTSEISQVSCGSFLDSGEFSFIDLSKETGDLDGSESCTLNKSLKKVISIPVKTSSAMVLEEPISLPSLGSVKSDLFQDIDLESSILSVASLTSEVADNSSRNKENDMNCDKTPENMVDSPITVFDRGDDTLNADTIGSDTEIFDDDISTASQDILPLDPDAPLESAQKRTAKKLTPKEKRQTFEERYRTYTIRDLKGDQIPDAHEVSGKQARRKATRKERRLNERERFLTRTLDREVLDCKTEKNNEERGETMETEGFLDVNRETDTPVEPSESVATTENNVLGCAMAIRNGDENRYLSRNSDEETNPLNNLLPISPAERREILNNAKMVAISLKTAAQDVEPETGFLSDSDAEGSHKTLVIDTATYNKNSRVEVDYRLSDEENLCDEDLVIKHSEEDLERKGAKILKPTEKDQLDVNEAAAKAIRGRRKQVYSSPFRKNSQISASSMPASPKITPNAVNAKKLYLAAAKSLPNVPKSIPKTESPTLFREGTFTKEEGTAPKNQQGMRHPRSIPVLNKKQDVKQNVNATHRYKSAPVLRTNKSNSDNTANVRPVSSYTAKSYEKTGSTGLSLNRHSSAGATYAGNRISAGNISGNLKKSSSSGTTTSMKNSTSNQNIKNVSTVKGNANFRSKTVPQSPKSQSSGSLDLESNSDKGKQKTPKREVTSKIANLWKKVEDTKKKEKNAKDNRVWITPDKGGKGDSEGLVVEKEEILELSSGKVVRSSTFQALGAENSPAAVAEELRKKSHRNSGDFYSGKWQTERKNNFEGKNVISAIVPPYNYHPPSSVPISSPPVKQVDTFHKGSVKVTTV